MTLLGVSGGVCGVPAPLGSWFWGASWVREGWSWVPQGTASPAAAPAQPLGKTRQKKVIQLIFLRGKHAGMF